MASPGTLHEWIEALPEEGRYIFARPDVDAVTDASPAAIKKLADPAFLTDVPPLLRSGLEHDAAAAWARVHATLVSRLPGDPWKGDGDREAGGDRTGFGVSDTGQAGCILT